MEEGVGIRIDDGDGPENWEWPERIPLAHRNQRRGANKAVECRKDQTRNSIGTDSNGTGYDRNPIGPKVGCRLSEQMHTMGSDIGGRRDEVSSKLPLNRQPPMLRVGRHKVG